MYNRRDFLNATAIASSLSLTEGRIPAGTSEADGDSVNVIDTNISLFQWPFRKLPYAETESLVKKLKTLGVRTAWASSFDGILHRDINSVNERLAAECKQSTVLHPVGVINPELPNWEADFDHCVLQHKMHAVRLFPNYHQYELSDQRLSRLLARAESRKIIVQLCVALEDMRTQHPLVQITDVDLSPLSELARRFPKVTIQILNHRSPARLPKGVLEAKNIHFDTARADDTDGIQRLMSAVGLRRVLYGSHSPFLIPEAALIRAAESKLEDRELVSVLSKNAKTLVAGRRG